MNLFGGLRKLLGIDRVASEEELKKASRSKDLVATDPAYFEADASESRQIPKPAFTSIATDMMQPQPAPVNIPEFQPFTGMPNQAFSREVQRQESLDNRPNQEYRRPSLQAPNFADILKRPRF